MKRSNRVKGSSLHIAFVFVCLIALLFFAGIILKLFFVLHASTFDGTHQYIVAITGNPGKGAVIIYNPQAKSAVMLQIKNKAEKSFTKDLDILPDASISVPIESDIARLTGSMLFRGKQEKGMTVIDKLRLLIFVNTLKPSDFRHESISLPVDFKTREKLFPSLFFDQALYNENKSIAIINATNVYGFGSKVAHMLTTIGVNVVSVTTAGNLDEKTRLTSSHPNSYTVKRLGRLFHVVPLQSKNQIISDSTLTLGKDSLSQLQ